MKRPLPTTRKAVPATPHLLDIDPKRGFEPKDIPMMLDRMTKQGPKDLDAIDEVTVRLSGLYPAPTFQTNVKFRDRRRGWATFVTHDAYTSLAAALYLATKTPKEIQDNSTALYHQKQEKAKAVMDKLREETSPGLIVDAKVELEPMMGWVVVLFVPKDTPDEDLLDFAGKAEVREIENTNEPPRRRKGTVDKGLPSKPMPEPSTPKSKPSSAPAKSKPSGPPGKAKPSGEAADPGQYGSMTKSALIKEHQRLFGKQPNNKLDKDEIIAMILEKSKTSTPPAPAGDDDEDLM